MKSLSEMIKYLRKRKGLTQRQLGEEVGLTYQSVQKWENGTGKPTTTQLSAVCRVLGITVEQMLAGELPDSDNTVEQPQHIAVPVEKDSTEGGLGALERLQYELRIKELELEKEQMANQFKSEIIQLKDQEIERQRKEIERQRSTAS